MVGFPAMSAPSILRPGFRAPAAALALALVAFAIPASAAEPPAAPGESHAADLAPAPPPSSRFT